ncbi:hypothetical protein DDA93_06410 [Arthrobacter sp. Bz4]|nr:hypothetical protein DDA93_06410 [Arthrobacter sp. Bz4]
MSDCGDEGDGAIGMGDGALLGSVGGAGVAVWVNDDPRSAGSGSARELANPAPAARTPLRHTAPTNQVWSDGDFMS